MQFKAKIMKILKFDIHLVFACLREAASAKAGILTFGIKIFVSDLVLWISTAKIAGFH
jgi:hypothetical protein